MPLKAQVFGWLIQGSSFVKYRNKNKEIEMKKVRS